MLLNLLHERCVFDVRVDSKKQLPSENRQFLFEVRDDKYETCIGGLETEEGLSEGICFR